MTARQTESKHERTHRLEVLLVVVAIIRQAQRVDVVTAAQRKVRLPPVPITTTTPFSPSTARLACPLRRLSLFPARLCQAGPEFQENTGTTTRVKTQRLSARWMRLNRQIATSRAGRWWMTTQNLTDKIIRSNKFLHVRGEGLPPS